MYSKEEETACLNNGGSYEKFGKLQAYDCNMPASDAGKTCADSSGCEGLCLAKGECSPNTINFGCIPLLEKGEEVTICID